MWLWRLKGICTLASPHFIFSSTGTIYGIIAVFLPSVNAAMRHWCAVWAATKLYRQTSASCANCIDNYFGGRRLSRLSYASNSLDLAKAFV